MMIFRLSFLLGILSGNLRSSAQLAWNCFENVWRTSEKTMWPEIKKEIKSICLIIMIYIYREPATMKRFAVTVTKTTTRKIRNENNTVCLQASAALSSGSVGGRRISRSKSSRSRSGIEQLIGCRDCSRREAERSRIIVPDQLFNDSLSDSPSEPTVLLIYLLTYLHQPHHLSLWRCLALFCSDNDTTSPMYT